MNSAARWTRTVFTLSLLLLAGLTHNPAAGLSAVKERVLGQVIVADTARIDGENVGLVLSVDRPASARPEEYVPPQSELVVVPTADPSTWLRLRFSGSTTQLAVADADADGNDDVAIAHPGDGPDCPASVVKNAPCGRIRVFDGPALRRGEALLIARIDIAPTAQPCTPSVYFPSSMAFSDVTGDGRAELAFGQLGMYPGTCGVVHVFPGERLEGRVSMEKACASMVGPKYEQGGHPDQFGQELEFLAGGEPQKPYLAIAAPYTTNGEAGVSGRVAVYDLMASCMGENSLPSGVAAPAVAFDFRGTRKGQLAGIDMAFADDVLWIASSDLIEGFDTPSFTSRGNHSPPKPVPLSVAGDLDGDGRSELMVGPWVITPEGRVLLHLGPFATETFRGAFVGRDKVLSSDKFGVQLWSLSDVWNPRLLLVPQPRRVSAGEVVNVSIAEMISLVPTSDNVGFTTLGGKVVESGADWLRVQAGGPGQVIVQGTILTTTTTVRIPVDPRDDHVEVSGPNTVQVDHPLVARVYAPQNSTVNWDASPASPAQGSGSLIRVTYGYPGSYTINIQVALPDGTQKSLEHAVQVLAPPANPLTILGPSHVAQGESVQLQVSGGDEGHTYTWSLEGAQLGVATLNGASIRFPTAGWGPMNVTVVEQTGGQATRVGHAQVVIENLAPVIRSLETKTEDGLQATLDAMDPGEDNLMIRWFLDGGHAGNGARLNLPLPPGRVNLTVTVTDEAGAAAKKERALEITSSWRVVPADSEGEAVQNPDEEGAVSQDSGEETFPWKVDRLKGQPSSSSGDGGKTPGTSMLLVAAMLLVIVAVRARRDRRAGR